MTSSDIYSSPFRVVTVFLSSVGIILTPIYLLSMLRQIFYASGTVPTCDISPTCDLSNVDIQDQGLGSQDAVCFGTSCVLPAQAVFTDAQPREVFIAACFLVPIIGIGLYPKLATEIYDVKTVAINTQMRQAYTQLAAENPQIYAQDFLVPQIGKSEVATVLGVVK
jgi:NAD(P)H-quinone oxidoreductase subunit 4